jgi:ABC-type transporter MlaC component
MTNPISIKRNISILFILLVYLVIQFSILGEAAVKDPTPSVKKMIGFIRYKKNTNAIALIDIETFSSNLLKGEYENLSSDQKRDFQDAVKVYVENKSFPIALKYFDKVDITYEKPIPKGSMFEIPSSILYNGSQQIKFSWILNEKNNQFLVSDFSMDGKLISDVNREKQLLPLLKKEGFEKMLEKLKEASK